MFYVIVGIVEGLIAGLVFNWIVFSVLLDFGKSKPEWVLMVEVVIVIVFACLGFVIAVWVPLNSKDSENGC